MAVPLTEQKVEARFFDTIHNSDGVTLIGTGATIGTAFSVIGSSVGFRLAWESTIPAEVLLVLQYKPTFSPWIKALFLAVLNAFVFEPIAVHLGLYVMVHWSYLFSFPIYMILYLVSHQLAQLNTFKRLDES